MLKRIILLVLVGGALFSVGKMIFSPKETPVEARFVSVSRGDVHQVKAITGRLRFADEGYAYAATSGVVEKICVSPGQRVAAGEALLRLDDKSQEAVVSTFLQGGGEIAWDGAAESAEEYLSMDSAVLRSANNCTIRQVLVTEGMPVAAGTPVMRLSSQQQEIVCAVAAVDAQVIDTGQWAWLHIGAEDAGAAKVVSVGDTETAPATGLRIAEVLLEPLQHVELPEGAVVDVEVFLAGSDDVLSLPVEAITSRGTVWWVNEGRCTEIPAQIVLSDEMRAWVDLPEGLSVALGEFTEGQQVVEARE